jgi:hypothetical protein
VLSFLQEWHFGSAAKKEGKEKKSHAGKGNERKREE